MSMGKKIVIGMLGFAAILFAFVYSGATNNPMEKIQNTDKIEVFLSKDQYGGRKMKTITDPEEINEMLAVFESAVIGEEVTPPDAAAPNLSEYYLYYNGEKLNSFVFLGDDCLTAMVQPKFFKVTYQGKTPFELYQASSAAETTITTH